jgi:uncharacterized membrane protein (UPF0127 family)
MLFDFGKVASSPGFWMPDMKFNLDFIWIEQNPSTGSGQIVGITPNVPAPIGNWKLSREAGSGSAGKIENLPIYYPPSPVNWVVEVNSGWCQKYKIKTGDEVRLIN